jgi:hypothetical protein
MKKNSFLLILQIGLLVLAITTLYAPSLQNPFVFDDLDFASLSQLEYLHFDLKLRWLSSATLGWTVNVLGYEMLWLRLGNVLLHAANAILLFFLLRQLFRVTLTDPENSSSTPLSLTWFAFFAAIIFALHPIAVYGVTYLIQRSILMAMFFTLLMLMAYLQGLLRNGWYWMIMAALLYAAAVYSKEHSITAPSAAFALTFLIRKPSWALFKKIAPFFALSALIAVIVVLTSNKIGIVANTYEPNGVEFVELSAQQQGIAGLPNVFLLSILTQSFLFFKYLLLWLIPNPAWMSVDMRESFAVSYLSWPHTLGLVGFLAFPCAAIWLLLKQGKWGVLGFALLAPWLLFLTELTTVRVQEPFVLYRSYFWMPFLLVALPVACSKLAAKQAFLLLGIIAILLVPLSLNRLNTFSSALLLWDDAEKLVHDKQNLPGVDRIYTNRGHQLGLSHRYNEAIADFSTAIQIHPIYDGFYSDRATAYYLLGNYQAALLDYNHAIAINPQNPISFNGRALTFRSLGDEISAQHDFKMSCSLGLCP